VTEGIPKAFASCPVAYEYYRVHLAAAAKVSEKSVTLVGSLRLGYSLAPDRFGLPFTGSSDLDAVIVDEQLFGSATVVFGAWHSKITAPDATPSNPREARYWSAASKVVPKNIGRGFIDTKYLPAPSPFVRSLHDPLLAIIRRWSGIPEAPTIKARSSYIRVYRDWAAAVRQISVNLDQLAKAL
jgi:hypothetical protein